MRPKLLTLCHIVTRQWDKNLNQVLIVHRFCLLHCFNSARVAIVAASATAPATATLGASPLFGGLVAFLAIASSASGGEVRCIVSASLSLRLYVVGFHRVSMPRIRARRGATISAGRSRGSYRGLPLPRTEPLAGSGRRLRRWSFPGIRG